MKTNKHIRDLHNDFFYGKIFKSILFFLILILFKKPLEALFQKYLINPFLSEIAENSYSDYCFLIIATLVIIYFIPKFFTQYIVSRDLFIIANAYLFIYLVFYRFNPEYAFKWKYFDLSYLNNIAYSDTLLLYIIGIDLLVIKKISIKIIYLFCSKSERQANAKFLFKEDKPINFFKEDLLYRKELAESIAFTIKETNTLKSSAFGIVGEWGSGKTSLMNLVKLYLDTKEFIIIDFSPWISFSKDDIIQDFFKTISHELKPTSSELPDLLMSYAKGISKDEKFKLISSFTDLFDKQDYNLQVKKIDSILSQINKRIVVFIDDLDRVESSIIIHIIQLIRSSANFKNLIFVVGYDKGYITNAIKFFNNYNSEHYLEKIFSNEFSLPIIDEETLKNYISKSLQQAFPNDLELKDILEPESIFKHEHFVFDKNIIKTIRDAKRFVNFFISSYTKSGVQGEVCVEDFLKIEMLRYKYYMIYLLLETNSSQYLTSPKEKVGGLKTGKRYVLNKIDNEYLIEKTMYENMNDLLLSNGDIKVVMNLLVSIFDESEGYYSSILDRNKLSVIFHKNFKKYFSRRISHDDLSHKEFVNYYNKDFLELRSKVIQWLTEGKQSLVITKFNEIELRNIGDIESYKKLIKIYFEIGRYRNPNASQLFQGYDVDDLIYKIQWTQSVQDIFNNEKYLLIDFINELLLNAPYPYYYDSILLRQVNESFGDDFVLPKTKVQELLLNYLRQFCDNTSYFSSDVWSLMHNCEIVTWTSNGNGPHFKNEIKNPKALEIVLAYGKKHPYEFIMHMVDYRIEQKAISSSVKDLFGSFELFKEYLNLFTEEQISYLNDIKGLYDEFEKTGFRNYVTYDFVHLSNRRN